MSIKGRSAKQKGSRKEREVADAINKAFNCKCRRTPMSGALPDWKGDICQLPEELNDLCLEVKCQEKTKIWQWLEQAERESGRKTPVLLFSRNRSKTYAVMEMNDWLNLLLEARVNEGVCCL